MYLVCRLLLRRPPLPSLFPYTTLFRSARARIGRARVELHFRQPRDRALARRMARGRIGHRIRVAVDRGDPAGRGPLDGEATRLKPSGISDRKSTRLNSSHRCISYAVFCFVVPRSLLSFPTRRSSDLLARVSGGLASSYTFVNPVIALLLGVWLAGELVTAFEWLSTAVILLGVVLLMARRPA